MNISSKAFDSAELILGAASSLIASFIILVLSYYSKKMRSILIRLLGRFVRIDIDRVYANAKQAQTDIIDAIAEAKDIRLMMGRGNELQSDTYNGLLQSPKKFTSVKILLPQTRLNEHEIDWVEAREKEVTEFDEAFDRNILREQINLTISFLQKTVKSNQNFNMRFFNAPHIGKVIITNKYLFYYMMGSNTHGRECKMYRCNSNTNTYNAFSRLFDTIWKNSCDRNEKRI